MELKRGNKRLDSIDVFRAVTMLLMVFVNDLWTDRHIPEWLEHVSAQADGMGFADVIFPAFLFIVGLSIPLAIGKRIRRGESVLVILRHILLRSLALIVMGLFQMNLEHYSFQSLLPQSIWIIIVTFSFFLIWLKYPKEKTKKSKLILQSIGVGLLILMAIFYRGEGSGDTVIWMRSYWWGILGLIGWAYLICAGIFLGAKGKMVPLFTSFLFFILFNSATELGWIDFLDPVTHYGFLDLGNASNSTLVMAGVLATVIYQKQSLEIGRSTIWFVLIATLLIIFGFITRPLWGISKIRATPSWTTICGGICFLFFIILIFLMDQKGKENWFKAIKPAGTSTLTCYLLPYFHEAIFLSIIGIRLPLYLRTGGFGVVKSLLFAFVIVLITGLLERKRWVLKV